MRWTTRFNHHGRSISSELITMGAKPLTKRVTSDSLTAKNHHDVAAFQMNTASNT